MTMEVLDARFVAAARQVRELPAPAFAEVAFAGRSNVGKSSLINTLLARRKLARTSSTPGATRAIQTYRVRLRTKGGEAHVDFVDLPGYGYAQRSKVEKRSWGPLIEQFLRERPGLRAVVVIVDARRGLEEDDRDLLEYLAELGRPVLLVGTKLDKLAKPERKLMLQRLSVAAKAPALGFSAKDGTGRDAILQAVVRAAHVAE